jgi:GT2 family glycosyltransferase
VNAAVVVATRNRAALLERLVSALRAQDGVDHVEIVIVDDASTDDTTDVLRRLGVNYLRLPKRSGPAAARNAGWRASTAPVVAFTDDDCVPQPGWLAALVRGLRDADLAQGCTRPDPGQAHLEGPFSRTLEVTAETGYYQTCNMGYRREVIERLGGFDERFRHPTGEDTDVAWRAIAGGARTVFVPDAVVHHDVRPSSFSAHLRDTWRWEGVVLAVRNHPELRRRFHRRWFWKPSHPPALLAAAGLVVLARRPVVGAALLLPYARYRTRVLPLRGGPRRRVAATPGALVADLTEVGVLALASARYRTLLL